MRVFFFCAVLLLSCTNADKNVIEYDSYQENVVVPQVTPVDCPVEAKNFFLHHVGDYLVLQNPYATDLAFTLLEKDSFNFVTSGGKMGPGNKEISRPGPLVLSANNESFWAYDYGKLKLWKFPIDSLVGNSTYLPTTSVAVPDSGVFFSAAFQNDTSIIGSYVIENSSVATYNTQENILQLKPAPYSSLEKTDNPECSGMTFGLSVPNNKYVCGYLFSDVLVICNLDGSPYKTILGPEGVHTSNSKTSTFQGVQFYKNYIFASYKGGDGMQMNSKKRLEWSMPTYILVFDLDGNYIQTWDLEEEFCSFSVDSDNKRVVLYFPNAEQELGYFNFNL